MPASADLVDDLMGSGREWVKRRKTHRVDTAKLTELSHKPAGSKAATGVPNYSHRPYSPSCELSAEAIDDESSGRIAVLANWDEEEEGKSKNG